MIQKILTLIAVACFLTACNKEPDFNYPEGTVGSSKITNFPILTLNGSKVIVIQKNDPFTDPGATAKEGTNNLTTTTNGTVDVTTPGVYTLTYSAVNKDGFSASTSRTVVVYSTDALAAAQDFSGNYLRSATGVTSVWTRIAPGVYSVFNPGGAAGTNLTAILFNPTGNIIFIPSQITNDGNTTSSSNEVYTPGNPTTYQLKILNPGYGTGLRTFIKQ